MAQEKSTSLGSKAEATSQAKKGGEWSKDSAKKDSRTVAVKDSAASGSSAKAKSAVPARKSDKVIKPTSVASDPERPAIRRRPAGPARARVAANDDLPSIGGLIFALQQRPSKRPFLVATILSAVWAVLGTLLSWTVLSQQLTGLNSIRDVLATPATLTFAATVILPIALFWFLATLAWRAQELRLVSSAMTEVAVRLAEPDRMAEQSVASLGQTVRRQVAAMNDAIARALGRAGELEALVHNEVAALERSYSENEVRIRRLVDELANERTALTNNSERIGEAIRGIGTQVTRDIHVASDKATLALSDATDSVAQSFVAKGEKITSALRAAGTAIDDRLTERGSKVTEQLVTQGAQAAQALRQAGDHVNATLKQSTEETTALVTTKGNSLLTSVMNMNEKIGHEVPMLLDRLGGEQTRLSAIIGDAVNNLSTLENALMHQTGRIETTLGDRTQHLETVLTSHIRSMDKSLADRTQMLDAAIGQRTRAIDASLGERAKAFDAALQQRAQAIDSSLVERTKSIDQAFARHVNELDTSLAQQTDVITRALIERSEAIQLTLSEQAAILDDTFLKGVDAIRLTTDNLTTQSVGSIEALASQAEVMRNISEGLLQQVSGLTQRFETQGKAIMGAAQLFESSQFKMDTVLDSRQVELSSLLEIISSKAVEIDGMMKNYSGRLESSLSDAQSRAQQVSQEISQNSQQHSRNALTELERMRAQTKQHAESAISDLRDRFTTVTEQVTNQMGSLSSMFTNSTKDMQTRAQQAADEFATSQRNIQQKVNRLPETTRDNAAAMHQAMSDQLRAIDELNAIARNHSAGRDISPPAGASYSQPQARPPAPARPIPYADMAANAPQQPQNPAHPTNLDAITQSLAQTVAHPPPPEQQATFAPAAQPPAPQPDNGNWSMGDLLARASNEGGAHAASQANAEPIGTAGSLNISVIAQAVDHAVADQIWQRYQNGERGLFNRSLYTPNGQMTFDEIGARYSVDNDFRQTVDRYLGDFERLLNEADQKDPGGTLIQNYLTSETGHVYLLLSHASGRLS